MVSWWWIPLSWVIAVGALVIGIFIAAAIKNILEANKRRKAAKMDDEMVRQAATKLKSVD